MDENAPQLTKDKNHCTFDRKLNHSILSESKLKKIRRMEDSGSIHYNTASKEFSKNYHSFYGEMSDEQRRDHMDKALGE